MRLNKAPLFLLALPVILGGFSSKAHSASYKNRPLTLPHYRLLKKVQKAFRKCLRNSLDLEQYTSCQRHFDEAEEAIHLSALQGGDQETILQDMEQALKDMLIRYREGSNISRQNETTRRAAEPSRIQPEDTHATPGPLPEAPAHLPQSPSVID